jgi:putative sterol carrier protein
MTDGFPGPVQQLTADEFVALVFAATDEQIEEGIRAAETAQVLDRIFAEMAQRFLPERAPRVAAEIQWVVTDGDEEHPYRMHIAGGRCSAERGRVDRPTATLTMDIVSFAKLVAGRREGVQLWMLHRLKVQGEVLLAVRLQGYFDRPKRPR